MSESITVSALNRYVKIMLESDEVLSQVWVEGEINGFHLHAQSGHAYFSIIEGGSSVRCVMFRDRASRARFSIEDGMYVVLRCRVSLYERDGTFQLYVDDIMPMGAGAAQQKLEEIRRRLENEGLFSEQRKKALPQFPQRIAVITSADGAALQDIINVTHRRDPFVRLLLYPVSVQGVNAAFSICKAIRQVNKSQEIDLVIIARGGGSSENLSCFNCESVVRSAAELNIPFISAVGHETDWTLLDYASDRRASTPSAAAEIAVPNIDQYIDVMQSKIDEIRSIAVSRVNSAYEQCTAYQKLIKKDATALVEAVRLRCSAVSELLAALDPAKILERGYAIAFNGLGQNISSVNQVEYGDSLLIKLADGVLNCTVNSTSLCSEDEK